MKYVAIVLLTVLASTTLIGSGAPKRLGCCTRVDVLEYRIEEAIGYIDNGDVAKARKLLAQTVDYDEGR